MASTRTLTACPVEDDWVLVPKPLPRKSLTPNPQRRELQWLLNELHETLQNLKSGLEDCYALLAPVDPGSTLVVSTPRNEIVKGHVTRVGTRIVKGVCCNFPLPPGWGLKRPPLELLFSCPLHGSSGQEDQRLIQCLSSQTLTLRLRTLPGQTYTINASEPIQLAPLTNLHALLNHSIELLDLTLTHTTPPAPSSPSSMHPPLSPTSSTATFLAAQLRLLGQSLTEATSLLKGPQPLTASDATWVSKSCAPTHFVPPTVRDLSVHWGVQDSCLVLWLRALEPAGAPVNLGMKFALAIGTARRLEHDEAEQVFVYTYPEGSEPPAAGGVGGGNRPATAAGKEGVGDGNDNGESAQQGKSKEGYRSDEVQVYVREKVRVESADPSLLSLSAKLTALTNTLSLARGNLAAVMGEDFED